MLCVVIFSWCNSAGAGMSYYETSAKDATNVAQSFMDMARKAVKILESAPPIE